MRGGVLPRQMLQIPMRTDRPAVSALRRGRRGGVRRGGLSARGPEIGGNRTKSSAGGVGGISGSSFVMAVKCFARMKFSHVPARLALFAFRGRFRSLSGSRRAPVRLPAAVAPRILKRRCCCCFPDVLWASALAGAVVKEGFVAARVGLAAARRGARREARGGGLGGTWLGGGRRGRAMGARGGKDFVKFEKFRRIWPCYPGANCCPFPEDMRRPGARRLRRLPARAGRGGPATPADGRAGGGRPRANPPGYPTQTATARAAGAGPRPPPPAPPGAGRRWRGGARGGRGGGGGGLLGGGPPGTAPGGGGGGRAARGGGGGGPEGGDPGGAGGRRGARGEPGGGKGWRCFAGRRGKRGGYGRKQDWPSAEMLW